MNYNNNNYFKILKIKLNKTSYMILLIKFLKFNFNVDLAKKLVNNKMIALFANKICIL